MPIPAARAAAPASRRNAWAERLAVAASRRWVSLVLVAAVVAADGLVHGHHLRFVARALADEPCHLVTAVVILGTITRWRGRAPSRSFVWAMLASSVLIDVDHLPLEFGSTVLTAGTPRPYTHALWLLVAVAAAAVVAARRARAPGGQRAMASAQVLAGIAWGVGAHFLRDIATARMSLWWPVSTVGVEVGYWYYLAALVLAAILPVPRGRASAGPASRMSLRPRP